jgi:hypothetical protein
MPVDTIPASTPDPVAPSTPAADALSEEVMGLLDEPTEPTPAPVTPAPEPKEPEAKEPDPAAEPAEDPAPVEPPATPATPPAQQPGTSDKALQKMQQDLGVATRAIAELSAKVQAGETLTPKEQAKVEQQKRKIDELRDQLGKEDADVIEYGRTLADTVLETDQAVQRVETDLRKENEALKQQLGATQQAVAGIQQSLAQQQEAAAKQQLAQQYKGVDVDATWAKSLGDTMALLGVSQEHLADPTVRAMVQNAANNTFHQRCSAATKSLAAKQPAKSTPAPAPIGARVSVQPNPGNAPRLSADQQTLALAMDLLGDE